MLLINASLSKNRLLRHPLPARKKIPLQLLWNTCKLMENLIVVRHDSRFVLNASLRKKMLLLPSLENSLKTARREYQCYDGYLYFICCT